MLLYYYYYYHRAAAFMSMEEKAKTEALLLEQEEIVRLEKAEKKARRTQRFDDSLLRNPFATSWNWVDAYLSLEHGSNTPLYRMLRQAMMGRRALLLIDGLDL